MTICDSSMLSSGDREKEERGEKSSADVALDFFLRRGYRYVSEIIDGFSAVHEVDERERERERERDRDRDRDRDRERKRKRERERRERD